MHTISIILLVKSVKFITAVLKNLNDQQNCDMEIIIIIANKYKDIFILSDFFNITIIYKEAELINPNIIFEILPITNGEYITILNNYDIGMKDRFITQIKFLNTKESIQIVSCLEEALDGEKSLDNIFITAQDIDQAITSFYIPLNLYTFVFRRTFLLYISKLINKFANNNFLEIKVYKEANFILQFLKYTKIEKVPTILYITRYSKGHRRRRIADYSLNSINPLYIYNKNKYIERREYMQSILANNYTNKFSKINYDTTGGINLLVICTNLNIGGTESYLLTLWKALKVLKINIIVLCSGGFMAEIFRLRGIMTFIHHGLKPYDKCNDYPLIFKIIAKYNIKAILCETDDCIEISVKISKIAKLPAILQLHGLYYTKPIIKKFNKFFQYIICVSENIKKYYLDYFDKESINNKLKVIPNFINDDYKVNTKELFLHKKFQLANAAKILVYTSRLSYSKGILCENFLDIFFKIAKNNAMLYAVVIGDGEEYSAIVEQGRKLNSLLGKEQIFIIGAADDLFNYYSDAILVIGTGRVALEAMFCSTPVLAYGLGGCGGIVNKKNINRMIESNFYDHSFNDEPIIKESMDKLWGSLSKFIYNKKIRYKNIQWIERFIKYLSSCKVAPAIKKLIYSAINPY